MTTVLNQLRASGGTDAIISVIEIQIDGREEPVVICDGFQDLTVTFESGSNYLAYATGMSIALPKKDASGAQNLRFAIANVRGIVVELIREAERRQREVRLIYRCYVSSDLTMPAENPLRMIVRTIHVKGDTVDVTAGFFDLIDTQFPRDTYNSEFAPALKYAN